MRGYNQVAEGRVLVACRIEFCLKFLKVRIIRLPFRLLFVHLSVERGDLAIDALLFASLFLVEERIRLRMSISQEIVKNPRLRALGIVHCIGDPVLFDQEIDNKVVRPDPLSEEELLLLKIAGDVSPHFLQLVQGSRECRLSKVIVLLSKLRACERHSGHMSKPGKPKLPSQSR